MTIKGIRTCLHVRLIRITFHGNLQRKILPGLNSTIALKHPNSVLSIFISRILATSSVRTRSNMVPTPAWWALLLCTWRPVASSIPSFTTIDRCEKPAISSSFQPGHKIFKHSKRMDIEVVPLSSCTAVVCMVYSWYMYLFSI